MNNISSDKAVTELGGTEIPRDPRIQQENIDDWQ